MLRARDNASYNDLAFSDEVDFYSRENQLAAVLAPSSRKRNPRLASFTKTYALERHFHDYGRAPSLTTVVEGRGELYQELCRRVWSSDALGLPLPWTKVNDASETSRSVSEGRRAAERSAGRPASRGVTPQLLQLVESGVLADGVELRGRHRERTYAAMIEVGRIRLPSGDSYRLPDDAAAVVSGRKKVSGMKFWLADIGADEWMPLRDVYDTAKRQGRLRSGRRRTATR